MKILYLSANGFPASSADPRGTFSLEHAVALQNEGAEVLAVDLQRDGFSEDVVSGLRILRKPRLRSLLKAGRIGQFFRAISELKNIRQTFDYDHIIISFFYLKYLPLIYLLGRRGVPITVIAHGGEVMPSGRMLARLKRHMFNRIDLVTPVSEFTETLLSCLISRRNSDSVKITMIPNGVDPAKLLATERDPDALRAKLSIAADEFVILSICNLVQRKGLHLLIPAINDLLKQGQNLRHVMIGSGSEVDRLKALADASGFADRFIFVSSVESVELASYYAMSDLFAMVSTTDWDERLTEGFGITYAEAMAFGKPVIGGAGSGVSTPVKDGFSGVLVDPGSPSITGDISAAISRFQTDQDYYQTISSNARNYVGEHISWAANAKATLAALSAIDERDG